MTVEREQVLQEQIEQLSRDKLALQKEVRLLRRQVATLQVEREAHSADVVRLAALRADLTRILRIAELLKIKLIDGEEVPDDGPVT